MVLFSFALLCFLPEVLISEMTFARFILTAPAVLLPAQSHPPAERAGKNKESPLRIGFSPLLMSCVYFYAPPFHFLSLASSAMDILIKLPCQRATWGLQSAASTPLWVHRAASAFPRLLTLGELHFQGKVSTLSLCSAEKLRKQSVTTYESSLQTT